MLTPSRYYGPLDNQLPLDLDPTVRAMTRTIDDSLSLMLANPELTAEQAFGAVSDAAAARRTGSLQ